MPNVRNLCGLQASFQRLLVARFDGAYYLLAHTFDITIKVGNLSRLGQEHIFLDCSFQVGSWCQTLRATCLLFHTTTGTAFAFLLGTGIVVTITIFHLDGTNLSLLDDTRNVGISETSRDSYITKLTVVVRIVILFQLLGQFLVGILKGSLFILNLENFVVLFINVFLGKLVDGANQRPNGQLIHGIFRLPHFGVRVIVVPGNHQIGIWIGSHPNVFLQAANQILFMRQSSTQILGGKNNLKATKLEFGSTILGTKVDLRFLGLFHFL
mmetsp:Transcript_45716/g.110763  ORF Transcript_45716/g.110763 Transcript_45716/m.110763 type:complete len:268 (-) Transcript_45716:407-1210(-)